MSDLKSRLQQLDAEFAQKPLHERLRELDQDQVPLIDPVASDKHVQEADALAKSEKVADLEEAVRKYEAAIRLNPQNSEAPAKLGYAEQRYHYYKGTDFYNAGNQEGAIGEFQKARQLGLKQFPLAAELIQSNTIENDKVEDLEDAVAKCEFAAKVEPESQAVQEALRLSKQKYHYRKGSVSYEAGNLVDAVQNFREAAQNGWKKFPEIKEWETNDAVKARDWNSIKKFAESLEQLLRLRDFVAINIYNDYGAIEQGLAKINFDGTYVQPFLFEATRRRDDNVYYKYKDLGELISAMINKVIKPNEKLALDLSKALEPDLGKDEDRWKIEDVGYHHSKGTLFLTGKFYSTLNIGEQMTGGSILIEAEFRGEGSKIGQSMSGGRIVLSNNGISGSLYSRLLEIGLLMNGGDINVNSSINNISVGHGMKRGSIKINKPYSNPAYKINGTVGCNMEGGSIEIDGHVVGFSLAGNIKGGSIHIKGNFSAVYCQVYCHSASDYSFADGMTGGSISIGGNVNSNYIANGMTNGEIYINGDVSSSPHIRNSGVGYNIRGGLITIMGKALIASPSNLYGGTIRINGKELTIRCERFNPNKEGLTTVYLRDKLIVPSPSFIFRCNVMKDTSLRTYR